MMVLHFDFAGLVLDNSHSQTTWTIRFEFPNSFSFSKVDIRYARGSYTTVYVSQFVCVICFCTKCGFLILIATSTLDAVNRRNINVDALKVTFFLFIFAHITHQLFQLSACTFYDFHLIPVAHIHTLHGISSSGKTPARGIPRHCH